MHTAPVTRRLGDHAVFTEFGLGLRAPELSYGDSAIEGLCYGRLAAYAYGHLDVGDVVELRGYVFVTPDLEAGRRAQFSIVVDELGVPGPPTLRHRPTATNDPVLTRT